MWGEDGIEVEAAGSVEFELCLQESLVPPGEIGQEPKVIVACAKLQ